MPSRKTTTAATANAKAKAPATTKPAATTKANAAATPATDVCPVQLIRRAVNIRHWMQGVFNLINNTESIYASSYRTSQQQALTYASLLLQQACVFAADRNYTAAQWKNLNADLCRLEKNLFENKEVRTLFSASHNDNIILSFFAINEDPATSHIGNILIKAATASRPASPISLRGSRFSWDFYSQLSLPDATKANQRGFQTYTDTLFGKASNNAHHLYLCAQRLARRGATTLEPYGASQSLREWNAVSGYSFALALHAANRYIHQRHSKTQQPSITPDAAEAQFEAALAQAHVVASVVAKPPQETPPVALASLQYTYSPAVAESSLRIDNWLAQSSAVLQVPLDSTGQPPVIPQDLIDRVFPPAVYTVSQISSDIHATLTLQANLPSPDSSAVWLTQFRQLRDLWAAHRLEQQTILVNKQKAATAAKIAEHMQATPSWDDSLTASLAALTPEQRNRLAQVLKDA